MELGKIIDDNSEDDNTSTNNNHTNKNGGEALSKGGILEKVMEWNFNLCNCYEINDIFLGLRIHFTPQISH